MVSVQRFGARRSACSCGPSPARRWCTENDRLRCGHSALGSASRRPGRRAQEDADKSRPPAVVRERRPGVSAAVSEARDSGLGPARRPGSLPRTPLRTRWTSWTRENSSALASDDQVPVTGAWLPSTTKAWPGQEVAGSRLSPQAGHLAPVGLALLWLPLTPTMSPPPGWTEHRGGGGGLGGTRVSRGQLS